MIFDNLVFNLTTTIHFCSQFFFTNFHQVHETSENAFAYLKFHYNNVLGSLISESPITFTNFQLNILKAFLLILVINLVLIRYYWKKYGSIITDRFIRPSTLKEIEELKLSVAKLKLPKEHSPRH